MGTKLLSVYFTLIIVLFFGASSYAYTPNPEWLVTAQGLMPKLQMTNQVPLRVVSPVHNASEFLRWTMEPSLTMDQFYQKTWVAGDSFILDFGGHRTGYFSFYIGGVGYSIDAPAYLQLTFGEVPGDVAESFLPYTGTLSEGWLPWETIHVDYLPQQVNMPRRYAFRYVKIDIIATSPNYAAKFANISATAVTSATSPLPPPSSLSPSLLAIDSVGVATLRDVMQTSFEDGPKRDRRLWIGDMRVMALSNHVTFQNYNLAKRCLYLFASFPISNGFVPSCAFEYPSPHADTTLALDYAAIYVTMLYEYVNMTGDVATGKDLWVVAQTQMDLFATHYVNSQYLFNNYNNGWVFVDWYPYLEKEASMQGILIWAFRHLILLGDLTGNDVSNYTILVERMTQAALSNFWDNSSGLFVSNGQISWSSQAWLILADVVNATQATTIFTNLLKNDNAVLPSTPYLYHYSVEAMYHVGFDQAALQIIEEYWGGMVERGADTFWEVYVPQNSTFSPYNSIYINSFCHGWSSTVSYFLRNF